MARLVTVMTRRDFGCWEDGWSWSESPGGGRMCTADCNGDAKTATTTTTTTTPTRVTATSPPLSDPDRSGEGKGDDGSDGDGDDGGDHEERSASGVVSRGVVGQGGGIRYRENGWGWRGADRELISGMRTTRRRRSRACVVQPMTRTTIVMMNPDEGDDAGAGPVAGAGADAGGLTLAGKDSVPPPACCCPPWTSAGSGSGGVPVVVRGRVLYG